MKRTTDFWLVCLGLLLLVALLAPPCLGQAKDEGPGSYYKMQRENLIKEMNLTPEKAKEFLAVGDKYDPARKEAVERIKKNEGELEKALAAPQPDEGKIKGLVAAITADQEKLFETFKAQRQGEMALLTPVQQGKFLMTLKKWHEEMRKK